MIFCRKNKGKWRKLLINPRSMKIKNCRKYATEMQKEFKQQII